MADSLFRFVLLSAFPRFSFPFFLSSISSSFTILPHQEVIKRWGLENRLQTAGENKAIDHPFTEKNEVAVARTQRVITIFHHHFIAFVKASRGDRLKGDENHLFSGEYWTGKEALEMGLIDGVETDINGFLEKKFGDKVILVQTKGKENFLQKILNREAKMEVAVGEVVAEVMDQVEERLDEIRWSTKFK